MIRKQISAQLKLSILKRDKYTCQYCGATGLESSLEIDHKHPVSKGGTNDSINLLTACYTCNREKSANLNWQPLKTKIDSKIYKNYSNEFLYIRDKRVAEYKNTYPDPDIHDKNDLLFEFYRIHKDDIFKQTVIALKLCVFSDNLQTVKLNLTESQINNIEYWNSWKSCLDNNAIQNKYYNDEWRKRHRPDWKLLPLESFQYPYNPNF
jgi:hypothetical protein